MAGKLLPRITIAIPTLNRVAYLTLAIQSALAQDYPDFEVVVSNNASTDDTSSFLHQITDRRLRVLEQKERLAMTGNWNACLAAASGDYFLLLSDDDLLEPNAIRQLIDGFSVHGGAAPVGFVYCGGCVIDSDGHITRELRPSPVLESADDLIVAFLAGQRDLRFCGVMLRKSDLKYGFPGSFKVACDAAVWMQVAMRYGSARYIPGPLMSYRLHPNLSAATHLDVWRAENQQLLDLVTREYAKKSSPDPLFIARVTSVVRKIERDMIIGRINESFQHDKRRALAEYADRIDAFWSPFGIMVLAKGVVSLFLPPAGRLWLKRKVQRR